MKTGTLSTSGRKAATPTETVISANTMPVSLRLSWREAMAARMASATIILPAEAGDDILTFDHLDQHAGDDFEHLVAEQMAEAVVEFLKMIDVDHQQAERGIFLPREIHLLVHHMIERLAVINACEEIALRFGRHFFQVLAQGNDFLLRFFELLVQRRATFAQGRRRRDDLAQHVFTPASGTSAETFDK